MPDPLPSWNEGAAKSAIVDFVAAVTAEGGKDYIPPADRIATFDNDGTLWCEQPLQTQFFFGDSLLQKLGDKDPSLKARAPYKAFFDHDLKTIAALGKRTILDVLGEVHSGVAEDDIRAYAREWITHARHPKLGKLFTALVYQPQLELLDYLRTNGFMVFIVSGGGSDLIRSFSEEVYGIPRSQVVGSSMRTRLDERDDGSIDLVRLREINSFDDRDAKPQNIALHIGRRPVFAFGNSDGDLAMIRYTLAGEGRRLGLIVHHDDAVREFAYDRDFSMSPLVDALDNASTYGIRIVSIKDDWGKVFVEG